MKLFSNLASLALLLFPPVALSSRAGLPITNWASLFPDWTNTCDVSPLSSEYSTEIEKLLEAEVMLVPVGSIARRADNPNYWQLLSTSPLTGPASLGSIPYCSGSNMFPGETRLSPSGRSGFLVGPDTIITASHTGIGGPQFDPGAYVAVFGLNSGPPGSTCTTPDFNYIPDSNVFEPRYVNPLVVDMKHQATVTDIAAFKLQRSTAGTGRRYLRFRRYGTAEIGDPIAMADHGERLLTKVQTSASYMGVHPTLGNVLFNRLFMSDGSSGAPLFNLERRFVEEVLAYGPLCNRLMWSGGGTCVVPVEACPGPTEVNMLPISTLAPYVESPELRVSPLTNPTYVVAAGVTSTLNPVTYSLTTAPSPSASTLTSVSLRPFIAGEPSLLNFAALNTSLLANTTTSVAVTPIVPSTLACGIYQRTIEIKDWSHSFWDRMTHTFEVGMTDVEIESPKNTRFESARSYSNPAQLTYTLKNPRPSAVSLTLSTTATWLNITSPTLITLQPKGQPGDSTTVTVSLSAAAYSLPTGAYASDLVILNTSVCPYSTASKTLPIALERGQISITNDYFDEIPSASTLNLDISVPYALCPTNVASTIHALPISTVNPVASGIPIANWVPYLTMQVQSNPGMANAVSRTPWTQEALPAAWVVPSYTEPMFGYPAEDFVLDDAFNLAPNGNGLSAFRNRWTNGIWRLILTDGRAAGSKPQAMMGWTLRFWDPGTRCSTISKEN